MGAATGRPIGRAPAVVNVCGSENDACVPEANGPVGVTDPSLVAWQALQLTSGDGA